MPSTATSRNRFEKQGTGDNTNTWGAKLNSTGLDLIDEALDGHESIALTGNHTLTSTNYASDQARKRFLTFTGTGPATITVPAVSKLYFIRNSTSGTLTITMGGSDTATLLAGTRQWVVCDGMGVYTDTTAPSAAAAATSATNAATSATNAANSASAASTSATNAANSATAAAASALAADASADAAAASASSINDASLVHLAGAETITGVKTFQSGLIINGQTLDGLTATGVSIIEAANTAAVNAILGGRAWTQLSSTNPGGAASVSQTGLADYTELVVVFEGVSHNDTVTARGLVLYTSETNGSSYPSGVSISNTITAASTVTGAAYITLTARASLVFPAKNSSSYVEPTAIMQAAKANAARIDWISGNFDAGTITIYGR